MTAEAAPTLGRARVVVVGPGRVGTTLAVALQRAGHRVLGAVGGSEASRDRFSSRLAGVRTVVDPAELVPQADLVVLATPDDVLAEVVTDLVTADLVGPGHHVVHVAGAHGLAVLRRAHLAGAHVAACHPAQTVPTAGEDPDVLVGAAWAVTAARTDLGWACDLVEGLGGDPHVVPDDRRVLYHAGLAVASNAAGAVVALARQLLLAASVDTPEAFLGPLVDASVRNAIREGAPALTGPVVRGDAETVAAHLAALDEDLPRLGAAYRAASSVLLDQVAPGLAPWRVEVLAELLRPTSAAPWTDTTTKDR